MQLLLLLAFQDLMRLRYILPFKLGRTFLLGQPHTSKSGLVINTKQRRSRLAVRGLGLV